jgi:hypothetical protein
MSSRQYYLARNQKTYGPLSHDEIESLRRNGQLETYSWICQEGDSEWTALDLPPPLPQAGSSAQPLASAPARTNATAPELVRSAPPVQPAFQVRDTRIHSVRNDAFRAILFDSRNAVTAWVAEATADGCELRSESEHTDPFFVQKAGANIHLHEVATGKSTRIPVRVSHVFRREGQWIYKVRWAAVPSLFAHSEAA